MNHLSSPPSINRWMITITIMLVAIIEVLDMTIVNVAMPQMMGALGTTSDKITWVLTSYIVTSAIFMLFTGFFDQRFGRKRVLLICISGFIISSALCGASSNLSEIVFFRLLQGIFGSSLVPLSQTILQQTFSKQEQGKAMAIWGIGIMAAPVLGPTIGGYITEYLNWRWVFYINVPICSLSLFMTMRYIKQTVTVKSRIDWLGAILLAIGVGALQLFLDQGNNQGWFQSKEIIFLSYISVVFLLTFIVRGIFIADKNIINLHVFKDRNFAFATIMMTIFCACVLSMLAVQPILLENYFNYPASFTGLVMAPRGIASAVGMFIAGRYSNKIDLRKLMVLALILTILGSFMMSHYDLGISPYYWVISGIVQGVGIGLFFIPLVRISLSTIKPENTAEAAGIFSFSRNLGNAIGISILSTIISSEIQINWNQLSSFVNPFNQNLQLWLNHQGWQLYNPNTLNQLQQTIAAQSGMNAFIDCFWLVGVALIFLLPFVFMIKPTSTIKSSHESLH